MAQQGGDRTEKPTGRRKSESRREGSVARTQDAGAAMSFLLLLLIFNVIGKSIFETFSTGTREFLIASAGGVEQPGLAPAIFGLFYRSVGPVLGLTVVFAIVASVAQTGFVYSPKALKPKIKSLNPKQGLEKFKPTKILWELVRTLFKVIVLITIVWGPVREMGAVVGTDMTMAGWLVVLGQMIKTLLIRATVLSLIIAIADYIYNRKKMDKSLKMTKQEVKDEFKQTEGDQEIKGRRRGKAREMSRNRMLVGISDADVVLINPVRFAVALRYKPGDSAPTVIAKGAGRFAKKIRAEAYRNAVPVRQDPPLTRAIYRRCQIGQQIPAALFEAVAVILATIYRSKSRGRRVAVRGTAA